jgi:O-acetylserine/cysteine efflux transporter
MLGYVVWASLFSALSAGLMALVFEGAGPIRDALAAAPPSAWAAVLWQSFGNVLFGYVAWAWLLNRHPAAVIAPMSLLVPVFGIGASAIFLGEPVQPWKIAATLLVLGGLAFNLLWPRLRARFS